MISGPVASLALLVAAAAAPTSPDGGWPTYGGDPGGMRYSAAGEITPRNVRDLQPVWTYHTGALQSSSRSVRYLDFEATPVLLGETLYLTTPLDRVIALDAATGKERWTYDPKLADDLVAANYTSRGVALWEDAPGRADTSCGRRVLLTTLDARLIALDANTGSPCDGFGNHGSVNLRENVKTPLDHPYRFFGNTSPATVIGDVAAVGSAVGDNQVVEPEHGSVRGYDVRSGRLLWTWEAMPPPLNPGVRAGAGNVWGVMAADPEHHLLFVPSGSPSPDFFGGYRPGEDRDASSLVALDARTGQKVWAFQVVHHDLWDYDVAAEPLLFTMNGVPAVAVAGKVGMVFVFNRLTGEPLVPIEERPVPRSDIPGENASPTQPFSALPPLTNMAFDPNALAGKTAANVDDCAVALRHLRYEGVYTPPSTGGTLQYPGSLGGVNWGSMSFDPATGVLYANTNGSAYEIRLIARRSRVRGLLHSVFPWLVVPLLLLAVALGMRRRSPATAAALALLAVVSCGVILTVHHLTSRPPRSGRKLVNSPDAVGEVSPQAGAPFQIYRKVLVDRDGLPCTPTPWGSTVALNLTTRSKVFQRPLGTMIAGKSTGTVGFGAPIVTAGGLLFAAASQEPLLRAMDKRTGEELWQGKLPVPAQSTPMTYVLHGKQYVVVCAGGHGGIGTPLGDSVVAFALP